MRLTISVASCAAGSSVSRAADELYTYKQARSAYVANQYEAIHERAESLPGDACQLFRHVPAKCAFLHNLEHLGSYGARNGTSTERTEEFPAVVEGCRNFGRRDDRADRIAIANGLAEHDDVGYDALLLKAVKNIFRADRKRFEPHQPMQTPPASRTWAYTAAR